MDNVLLKSNTWSAWAWRPMMIGLVHPGTSFGIFLQMIASLNTVPPRIFLIVPLGDFHIFFSLNSIKIKDKIFIHSIRYHFLGSNKQHLQNQKLFSFFIFSKSFSNFKLSENQWCKTQTHQFQAVKKYFALLKRQNKNKKTFNSLFIWSDCGTLNSNIIFLDCSSCFMGN